MPPARAARSLLLVALGCAALPDRIALASASASTASVSDTTWRAFDQRDIQLRLRSGLEVSGRLLRHDSATITLLQASGGLATLRKEDIAAATLAPAATPTKRAARLGLRRSGGYFLLSPGAISQQFTLSHRTNPLSSFTYFLWGGSAGGYVTAADRFAFAGGLAIQGAIGRQAADLRASLVRFGLELRPGISGPRHFVYALLDFHGLVHNLADQDLQTPNTQLVGLGGTFGVGAQGLFGQRFLLGGELKSTLDRLYERQLEGVTIGGASLVSLDVRVLLGLKF